MTNPDAIEVGQVLRVAPPPGTTTASTPSTTGTGSAGRARPALGRGDPDVGGRRAAGARAERGRRRDGIGRNVRAPEHRVRPLVAAAPSVAEGLRLAQVAIRKGV